MQTLPAFHAYLGEKYAPKTVKMYWGDVKELALFLKNKKVGEISSHDLQQWIETLLSAKIARIKGTRDSSLYNQLQADLITHLWQTAGRV